MLSMDHMALQGEGVEGTVPSLTRSVKIFCTETCKGPISCFFSWSWYILLASASIHTVLPA